MVAGTLLVCYFDAKILFDHDDKLKSIGVTETYIFKDEETYLNYKNESSSNTDNTYNFIDEELKVDVTYEEKSIIENYNEMYSYMKKEGYSCIEETYEE